MKEASQLGLGKIAARDHARRRRRGVKHAIAFAIGDRLQSTFDFKALKKDTEPAVVIAGEPRVRKRIFMRIEVLLNGHPANYLSSYRRASALRARAYKSRFRTCL